MNKILLFLFAFSLFSWAQGQNPLQIPPTLSGTEIELNLQPGSVQFYGGEATATMGANGDILGPTLILQQGDFVQFTVNNQLEDTTTLHWHGMHVSAENDGGPHTTIPPGTSWTPSFTILDKAATYWYHPHLHKKTDKHVSKGIAGLILVKDAEEAQLPLPRTYGVDDFPLVIQTKDFDANNQIVVHSNSDDVVMVNATLDPFLSVPAQVVRFRVLNGSSQRVFNLGLSNNQAFYQIASDGGLLAEPYETTRLRLGPGERAELLVDFSGMEGQVPYLKSYASELPNGFYGATYPGMGPGLQMTGYNPNPLNGSDFNILQFQVGAPTADPVTAIPASLVEVTPLSESDVNETRSLTFTPETFGPNQLNGQFLINNASFDLEVINATIPLNNVEIWELTNFSGIAHPFHIHDVQFYILTRDGVAPPVNEQGRKDVVLVRPMETVRFITKFEDFADDVVPYMYHCHMLTHEDGGMMGQFVVVGPTATNEPGAETAVSVYPNPSKGWLRVELEADISPEQVLVYDQLGREVAVSMTKREQALEIEGLRNGIFYLYLQLPREVKVQKVVAY